MKLVALTLAVLLAAGAHARVLQADAPSQLPHVKSVIDGYLNQVKDSVNKVLTHLDDTEYKDYKQYVTYGLNRVHDLLVKFTERVIPYGEQLEITTKGIRTQFMNDFESLQPQLEPQRKKLQQVLFEKGQQYCWKPSPKDIEEFHQKMEMMKPELQLMAEVMHAKIATDIREVNSGLVPIMETMKVKVKERLEDIKEMVAPFAQEYRALLIRTLASLKYGDRDLEEKLRPLAEDVKYKLIAMLDVVKEHVEAYREKRRQ